MLPTINTPDPQAEAFPVLTPVQIDRLWLYGHDAPIYGVIEGIIERSGTPYFSFKDLDENKPSGFIRIRVETIDYFLRRYRDDIVERRRKEVDIERELVKFEDALRAKEQDSYDLAMAGDEWAW